MELKKLRDGIAEVKYRRYKSLKDLSMIRFLTKNEKEELTRLSNELGTKVDRMNNMDILKYGVI